MHLALLAGLSDYLEELDYCSQLWSPSDNESINIIESVQVNHWERLNLLHLYSHERRRERYILICLWKIAEGHVKGYTLEFTDCDNGHRGRQYIV